MLDSDALGHRSKLLKYPELTVTYRTKIYICIIQVQLEHPLTRVNYLELLLECLLMIPCLFDLEMLLVYCTCLQQ